MNTRTYVIAGFLALVCVAGIGYGIYALTQSGQGSAHATQLSVPKGAVATTSPLGATGPGNTFTSSSLGFSFAVPSGFHAHTFLSGNQQIVLAQNASSTAGFQVNISSFSDSVSTLTAKTIAKDTGVSVTQFHNIKVNGAPGVSFVDLAQGGALYEVWFVHNQELYQAQTWAKDANTLNSVLRTWQFKNA